MNATHNMKLLSLPYPHIMAMTVFSLAGSCTATRTHEKATTSLINETLSIKELIKSLPPYSYYEGSINDTKKWLQSAKIERTDFHGVTCESVIYSADGCRGATRFYLNRETGKFWEQYYAWEPGSTDTLTEYVVVNGKLAFISRKDISAPIPR